MNQGQILDNIILYITSQRLASRLTTMEIDRFNKDCGYELLVIHEIARAFGLSKAWYTILHDIVNWNGKLNSLNESSIASFDSAIELMCAFYQVGHQNQLQIQNISHSIFLVTSKLTRTAPLNSIYNNKNKTDQQNPQYAMSVINTLSDTDPELEIKLKNMLNHQSGGQTFCLLSSNSHIISLSFDGKYWVLQDPNEYNNHYAIAFSTNKFKQIKDEIFTILGTPVLIEVASVNQQPGGSVQRLLKYFETSYALCAIQSDQDSPLYQLSSSEDGRALLSTILNRNTDPAFITSAALCAVKSNGYSPLYKLSFSKDGCAILSTILSRNTDPASITSTALCSVQSAGYSPLYWLSYSANGRAILSTILSRNPELITSECLHTLQEPTLSLTLGKFGIHATKSSEEPSHNSATTPCTTNILGAR